VFVVGCLGDQRAAAEVLFESESVSRNPAPSREKRQAAAGPVEEGAGSGKWWDGGDTSATITTRSGGQYMPDKDNFQAVMQPTIIDRAAFNQGENAQYEPKIEESETMSSLVARGPHAVAHAFKIRGSCEGGGKGYLGQDEQVFTISTNQDQHIAQPIVLNDQGGSFMDVTKDGLSPTLRAQTHRHEPTILQPIAVDTFNQTTNEHTSQTLGSSATDVNHYGAVINPPMAIRRLTPEECEKLQGFPSGWTRIPWKKKPAEECPDGPRYKACGNSMAVPVMRWIGQRINKKTDHL
jgi:DNA (cytosine-5)-methyltransferase 1